MAILAVGLLYLGLAAREDGWLAGERWLAMLAFAAVPLFWMIAAVSDLQLWPPLLAAMGCFIARRARANVRARAGG